MISLLVFACATPAPVPVTCYDDGDTANPDTSHTDDTGHTGDTGDTSGAEGPITLLDPEDGDTWAVDSVHTLVWVNAAPDGDPERWPLVVVEGSADGGATWAALEGVDGSGAAVLAAYDEETTFRWKVPAGGSAWTIRVRGYDATDGAQADITVAASQEKVYTWTEVTTAAPFAARDGAGALVYDGQMWLLGGWNPSDEVNFPATCNSEVWSTTDGLDWEEVQPQAAWEGRHTAGYAVFADRMWILGGDPIQGYYQPDAWSSADGVNWIEETDVLPWGSRVLHHTAVLGDTIYVMGGQTLPQFTAESEESAFYNDVWSSTDGVNWTRILEEAPWTPRGLIGGSAVLHDRIWLLGGGTYDTPDQPERLYYNDVWSTADGVSWTLHVSHAPWAPREYHDVAAFDDRMWVLEGYSPDVGNRTDVWYSADGENWYEVPDTPWPARHAASVFVYDGALWVVAGNNMTPDVWKLTAG